MHNTQSSRLRDANALRYINKFGWLRSYELSHFIFPEDASAARQRTDSLLKKLERRQLILSRILPKGAGKAWVLRKKGAELLSNSFDFPEGTKIRPGTNFGVTKKQTVKRKGKDTVIDVWTPSDQWQHDLLAAGVLAFHSPDHFIIYSEREIRMMNLGLPKIPDGLIINKETNEGEWLEVENSRKTGGNMRFLAEQLAYVANVNTQLLGYKINKVIVAYIKDALDEKGDSINHRLRVSNAIATYAKQDTDILFMPVELAGFSIAEAEYVQETIKFQGYKSIAKQLELYYTKTEKGVEAYYSGFHFSIDKTMDGNYIAWASGEPIDRTDTPSFYEVFDTVTEAKTFIAKTVVKYS